MHQLASMSRRAHRSLRLGALALLAAVALWPRARSGLSAAELDSGSSGPARGMATTHSVGARAEPRGAGLVSPPHTPKLTVAQANAADGSQLSN